MSAATTRPSPPLLRAEGRSARPSAAGRARYTPRLCSAGRGDGGHISHVQREWLCQWLALEVHSGKLYKTLKMPIFGDYGKLDCVLVALNGAFGGVYLTRADLVDIQPLYATGGLSIDPREDQTLRDLIAKKTPFTIETRTELRNNFKVFLPTTGIYVACAELTLYDGSVDYHAIYIDCERDVVHNRSDNPDSAPWHGSSANASLGVEGTVQEPHRGVVSVPMQVQPPRSPAVRPKLDQRLCSSSCTSAPLLSNTFALFAPSYSRIPSRSESRPLIITARLSCGVGAGRCGAICE